MLKELFPGSTDFTVAMFKIPQMSKHFSAMLTLRHSLETGCIFTDFFVVINVSKSRKYKS